MENEKEEFQLSPGILGVIALLSIGGLLLLGWGASSITGNLVKGPYQACCSVQPWGSSAAGYRQGYAVTNTELCDPSELPNRCCVRAGRERYNGPVSLISANFGMCSPNIAYPMSGYQACCSVQSYLRSPTGYNQGVAQTSTQNCDTSETMFDCCARAGTARLNLPVRVLGVKPGSCDVPQVSYPLGTADVRGYSACCSYETWRQSPMGYAQSTASTVTGYCDELETQSQCCLRTASRASVYPVKLLGSVMGACASESIAPERSYPIWLR